MNITAMISNKLLVSQSRYDLRTNRGPDLSVSWQIERAFRISKTDLRVRPVFRRIWLRIEAHICVAFVAYTIYKELEMLLSSINIGMSPKRAAELTHTMYSLTYKAQDSGEEKVAVLKMPDERQMVYRAVFNG